MSRSFRYVAFALAVAVAAISARPLPAQAKPDTEKENPEIRKALTQFQNRQFDEARKTLESTVREHPELPPADLFLVNWAFQLQQPNLARMFLEQAIVHNPRDPEPFLVLGNLALREQRVTEAEMDFGKAKESLANLSAGDRKKLIEAQTMSGLAAVAEARDNYKAAEKLLDDLVKLIPDDILAMQRLARAQFWNGNAVKAYDTLKVAKKADKDSRMIAPEAMLAQFYDQFGGKDAKANARKWYDYALTAYPEHIPTRQAVALWALNQGDIAYAKTQAEKCLAKDGNSIDALILRGVVALWDKDYKTAESNFEKAHLNQPLNFAAKNNLALALCEEGDSTPEGQGKLDKAFGYAFSNYQENQKNAEAMSTLGWVCYKRKDMEKCWLALQGALQASGGNMSSDTACYLAHYFFATAKYKEAKALLDAILAQDSKPFSMRKEALELRPKVEAEAAKESKDKSKDTPAPKP